MAALLQRYRCGAVILYTTTNLVQNVLRAAESILETLYLPLPFHNGAADLSSKQSAYISLLGGLFHDFREKLPKLDIRVILPCLPDSAPLPLSRKLDIIVSTYPDLAQTQASPAYHLIAGRIPPPPLHQFSFLSDSAHAHSFQMSDTLHTGSHEHSAVGGTFDHMHQGHQLLLAATALCSSDSCLVGVASGPLLIDKVLSELIQPLEERCRLVTEIMSDIRPGLQLDIVPISDPYGPTISDPTLQCLVVSEETSKGGEAVNSKRIELGMAPMDILQVPLIAGTTDKLSSTQQRKDLLGEYRELHFSHGEFSSSAYLIGLTGGTCSGKTTITKHLIGLGACIIDCDKLGHVAYEPSTPTYSRVVEEFGGGVLDKNGAIDRKVLGGIVFSDPDKLRLLNQIVWPAIGDLAQSQVSAAVERGAEVCVLDAAVLLEAGWERLVDEVWVAFVPEKEAIKRLVARDGISIELAQKRIAAQLSNEERIKRANVLFCSLWEPEFTCKQVDAAWLSLKQRILAKYKHQ